MADSKITNLTAAGSFLLADELPVNEAGADKKVTGTQIAAGVLGQALVSVPNDLGVGSSSGATNGRIVISQDNAPTVASGGSGVSALSMVAGATNTAGRVNATLTAVAPGVVIGVVTFDDAPLATAPIAVVCCLSGPTAGDAAPPDIGADTYTTSGFTLRSYGPTTVTTASYVIAYICIFT